jgi:glutathione peroxidase-family protein
MQTVESIRNTKVRYDFNRLKTFCEEQDIELLHDYENEKLNSKFVLEGKCKTENCDNICKKRFIRLVDTGCFCEFCTKQNRKEKVKHTCLERYGLENVSQSQEIKERVKQTCLEKYGVEYALQSQEIRQQIKETCLEKYGVEYALQSKEFREHFKQTCLEKYGVEHPMYLQETKDKIKETCLEKYGVEYALQSQEIRQQIKDTCLEKYGFENPFQNEEIKDKIKETCLEKYGVEHVMQNTEVAEKSSKNAYKLKEYTLPSGNIIKVQGYENYALDELLKEIPEEDIITGCQNVPEIWYDDEEGKKHRHFVDIFIPSQNRCIEIKSTWTAEKKSDCIFLKQTAGKVLGYQYEIWVYNAKGEKVECYK